MAKHFILIVRALVPALALAVFSPQAVGQSNLDLTPNGSVLEAGDSTLAGAQNLGKSVPKKKSSNKAEEWADKAKDWKDEHGNPTYDSSPDGGHIFGWEFPTQ